MARILIVADPDSIVLEISSRLSALGYDVAGTLAYGEQLPATVSSLKPDLILMDISLRGRLDGIEASHLLPRETAPPVVFVTARPDSATLRRAAQVSAYGYVLRPFEDRELEMAVEIALYKHQAGRELRQVQERYQMLVEQVPAVTYIVNFQPTQKTVYVSPQIKDILGYSQEEWLSQPDLWDRQLHPDDRERVMAEDRASENLIWFPAEYRIFAKDGRVVWLHDEARYGYDEHGQRLFCQGIEFDITARKESELLINRLTGQMSSILKAAGEGIYGAGPDGRLTFVNPALAAMLGWSESELAGRHVGDLCRAAPGDPDLPFERVMRSGMPIAGERTIFWRRDGSSLPVEFTCTPLFDNGTVSGTVTVVQDITGRKQAETAARSHSDELERAVAARTVELSQVNLALIQANRAKDDFLATMSHELRTPLNTVLALAESLQDGVYGTVNERQSSSLDAIYRSGSHLLQLINDVLDFSKLEAGQFELHRQLLSAESVCRDSLTLIRELAERKRLQLVHSAPPPGTRLWADARALKQVLVNLLSNAVKFTPAGGSIGLDVVTDVERNVISLAVWDTGIGIAGHDLARLFKPFTQLDTGLSRHFEGTGLGLALVSRLVSLHGGSVSVESQPGRGSRFTVSLPWTGARPDGQEDTRMEGALP